jgi:hexulose-6-phosphate isomerase
VGRAAFAGAQTSTDATCDKDICKAIKFHHVAGDMSVEDKFKLLKDVGFDGTEYRRRDDIDTKTLIRASEKTDLPIHGVINSSDSDLAGAIDLARELGATSVLYVAGRVNGETSYDENYRQTQEVIRKAIPHAEKREIPILIENVWNNFLLSPMEMARYIDELESDYVGAYFDTGNVVRFGWPEQWIRILGQRIGKLDIKEYSRDIQREQGLYKGFDVPLGEGSVDWPAVREALEQIGCTGWATKERGSGGRDYLAEVSRRMNKILALER